MKWTMKSTYFIFSVLQLNLDFFTMIIVCWKYINLILTCLWYYVFLKKQLIKKDCYWEFKYRSFWFQNIMKYILRVLRALFFHKLQNLSYETLKICYACEFNIDIKITMWTNQWWINYSFLLLILGFCVFFWR